MNITKRVLAVLMILAMLLPTIPTIIVASDASATVFFNPNGGSGGPGKVTATVGTKLTIPTPNPTKSGMVFRGWATTAEKAAIGDIAYSAGTSVTVNGDMTLYASYAYTVTLKCGNEGAGTASKTLYKFPSKELTLYHDKATVKANYGMYPKNNDQRSFIEWNTKQDSTTSKGTGTSYYLNYTNNASVTLYAIWGYPIQYNADGGYFPLTGDSIFLKYVCGYDDNNYQNPKTLYGNFDFPQGSNKPVKDGCRLYTQSGTVFYALLYADLSFFTTETAQQNLTIPPTGGKLPWNVFHTATTENGTTAVEFPAIWEPSVTYKANGGSGKDVVEWISWDWDGLHMYKSYKVRSNSFSKSGASFKGWNTEPDGSGKAYAAGATIYHDSSDPIVLYAQWSDGTKGARATEKHTVRFDANGGSNAPASQTKYWGTILTLTTQTPVRPGYKFMGWGPGKFSNTVTYKPGALYGVDVDSKLYAVWEECKTHSYAKVSSTASTCTTQGKVTYTCSVCKLSYDEYLDYTHTWGSWKSNGNGTDSRSCTVCGTTETRDALCDHVYDNGKVTQNATCTKKGVKVYTCTLCGESYEESIAMLKHSFTNYVSDNNATCKNDSTARAYCDYGCGRYSLTVEKGTQLDHVFTTYTFDNNATCNNPGTQTAYCDFGCENTNTIPYDGDTVEHKYTVYTSNADATCTADGTKTAYCDYGCNNSVTVPDEGSKLGHNFGAWVITTPPTTTSSGVETKYCSRCDATETRSVPKIGAPVISVDNYTVSITNANLIKDIRYAVGTYSTGAAIKAAEGNVAISNTLVQKYTVDGNFVYEMPNSGNFTFWIRMTGGEEYFIYADVTTFTPYVSAYGVKVTLHNLNNVKDFFIAKGEYNSYREIKDNGYIVSITSAKIGAKHDYSYTVYEPGVHTFLIRYNDGTEKIFHKTLTVDEPVFTTNGLQVTVSNLPDVKVIRTAYGTWNTVKELKATDTIRNFSAKTAIKGKDPYTIQYREEGAVTVIVEYNNGYVKVFHYNVQSKKPTMTLDGITMKIGNLDGLVVVRYAEGTYKTSSEVKNATGSQYIRPAAAVNGIISVSLKHNTTYTFVVQYNDESFYIYTVTTPDERPAGTYLMTVDPNGGTMPSGYKLKYYFRPQQKFQDVMGGFPVPTRPGYTFVAWQWIPYASTHT